MTLGNEVRLKGAYIVKCESVERMRREISRQFIVRMMRIPVAVPDRQVTGR
ncbi:MAG: hypothetical protein ACLU4J_15415 [Butyricimonas paravirosa]